jgi:hypothetical protein
LWQTLNHYLLVEVREAYGKEASPSAGVIESHSVKTTESWGVRGFDAGKKIKGRKRHIITDTNGFLVGGSFTVPMCRTATARRWVSNQSDLPSRGCAISSPTGVMLIRICVQH